MALPQDPLLGQVRRRLQGTAHVGLSDAPEIRRLIGEKRHAEALAEARRACETRSSDPAYAYWIGVASAFLGRAAEAEPWLELAVRANPRDGRAYAALGFIGKPLGHGAKRVENYRKAVELSPRDPELRVNCAEALTEAGEIAAAEREARAGLAVAPGHVGCAIALARAFQAAGRIDEGIALLEKSAASNDADAELALAHAYLHAGRYREGFRAYEARRKPSGRSPRVVDPGLPKPEWKGEALSGRRLLVVHEQGLGDTLQAMRYAASLAARGERVSAVVAPPLRRLLAAQPFLVAVYAMDEPIPRAAYDCWCLAMSLPGLLGEDGSFADYPRPYITAPKADAMTLPAAPGKLRAGLCWAGSSENPNDVVRTIEVQRFAPLADVRGVVLYSCQHGVDAATLPYFLRPPPVPIRDLADMATLLAQLDLLVSVDTAPAHLAGAMGKEVWMLSRWFGDWRWGEAGTTTPWYPSMRIVRQARGGTWGAAIAEVVSLLRSRRS